MEQFTEQQMQHIMKTLQEKSAETGTTEGLKQVIEEFQSTFLSEEYADLLATQIEELEQSDNPAVVDALKMAQSLFQNSKADGIDAALQNMLAPADSDED